jgi:hypothetical protein
MFLITYFRSGWCVVVFIDVNQFSIF